jgi:hypothetical protein
MPVGMLRLGISVSGISSKYNTKALQKEVYMRKSINRPLLQVKAKLFGGKSTSGPLTGIEKVIPPDDP